MDGDYRRCDASCATDGGDDNVVDVVDNNNEDDGFYCLFYRVDPLFVLCDPYDPLVCDFTAVYLACSPMAPFCILTAQYE